MVNLFANVGLSSTAKELRNRKYKCDKKNALMIIVVYSLGRLSLVHSGVLLFVITIIIEHFFFQTLHDDGAVAIPLPTEV